MITINFRRDRVAKLESDKRFLYVMLCILFIPPLLSGCVTIPEDAPSYEPAPPPDPGNAIVYFYRVGAYPTARTPSVFLNQMKIFDPPENAFTWIYVQEGKHKLFVDWAWDTGAPDLKADLIIKSGESYFVKISGRVVMFLLSYKFLSIAELIPQEQAEMELQKCCRFLSPQNHKINLATDNH